MKIFLVLLAIYIPQLSFARGEEAFEPGSCQGPVMSGKRALELMGRYNSVNLAANLPGGVVTGMERTRQKLEGEIGEWYFSDRAVALSPTIENKAGKLVVDLQYSYRDRGMDMATGMKCKGSSAASFECETLSERPRIGSGVLYVTLTDHCLRIVSAFGNTAYEQEWAYLLRF